jgi:two-component system nitrogen regulation sensor histidine kinase NtrY
MDLDPTLMGQALTNLVKNAGEAIESRREKGHAFAPRIDVTLSSDSRSAVLTISDNGIGLPPDRARLFEPYVTTREKGTGLGLPIVRKIIEEHGGTLRLTDAPDWGDGHRGASAEIVLPVAAGTETEPQKMAAAGGA